MKYFKPRCDCGSCLSHWQEEMHTVLTPITKTGILSKKNKIISLENGAWERLICKDCREEYSYSLDDKGRIVRGDKWIF